MCNRARNPFVWLTAAILCACGSKEPAGTTPTVAAPAHKPASPSDTLSRNMVSAVPAHKPAAVPVQVKFELHGRPDLAHPLDIELALVPLSASIDRVSGKIVTEEGLELVEGAQIPATDRPAEGATIRHTLKVLPRRDGIFILSALLTVDSAGQGSSETFSIPLIAGAGLPESPAKPPAGRPRATAAAQ
ncbi:MAG TPA: hypothetical protein VGZ05_03025 [Steroidobacteraceae bacterium]|jgi:hypothetical protein|nr:hypothetical protein [Steroidobacteraceae bacterium]